MVGKKEKQRLIILLIANMTGSEKILLFFIRKNKTPRCFKNVQKLSLTHFANKKACMTGKIYEKWLKE